MNFSTSFCRLSKLHTRPCSAGFNADAQGRFGLCSCVWPCSICVGDRSRANTRLAPTVTTACCISGEDKKLAPAAVPANSLRGFASTPRTGVAVNYDGISGTAQGSFPGHRWLASGGVTGLYRTQWLHFEPSARVYAKRDNSYVDSLGTPQAENSFSTGRPVPAPK